MPDDDSCRRLYPALGPFNKVVPETLSLGPPVTRAALRRAFDRFVADADRPALVRADPVELVHGYADPHDQEVVGLLVAAMAYGRVASIKASAREVLAVLGPRPAQGIEQAQRLRGLVGFVYRFQKQDDLPRFLAAVAAVRAEHGSLGAAFLRGVREDEPHYDRAMARFIAALRARAGPELSYGLRFLLPDPSTGGAAKRVCLYLRWMIRPADGLDLGTWAALGLGLSPAALVMPVDTHVARIAGYIGLTERRSQDLRCALEITEALAALAPQDPLVYDMALCHLGISGQCPRTRDVLKCGGCPIRAVCRLGPRPAAWQDGL